MCKAFLVLVYIIIVNKTIILCMFMYVVALPRLLYLCRAGRRRYEAQKAARKSSLFPLRCAIYCLVLLFAEVQMFRFWPKT